MKEEEIIANCAITRFNKLSKDVKPFLEYINDNDLKVDLHSSKIDADCLEQLLFLSCLCSTDISIPFNFISHQYVRKQLQKNEWLVELKPFGTKSKQGVVYKSLMFDEFPVIIKKAKSPKFDTITLRDYCVGLYINKVLKEAPFFVKTIGCYQHKNQFHIVLEYIDGINLKEFISDPSTTIRDFVNIFFQILLGLEVAQNKIRFTHYDLHSENVLLVHNNSPTTVEMYGYEYTLRYKYRPIIIDFGLSTAQTCSSRDGQKQVVGQGSLENKGIYDHISAGYDAYVFLLFCIDIVQKTNPSLIKGLTKLLHFYKLQTNLSEELLTNNHVKSLKLGVESVIPLTQIKYLLQHYTDVLDVNIREKRSWDKCLVEPVFCRLRSCLVDDTSRFLDGAYPTKKRRGLVKNIIENINIYYWYQHKIILGTREVRDLLEQDKELLESIVYDLNLQHPGEGRPNGPSARREEQRFPRDLDFGEQWTGEISVDQKNIFFYALEYLFLIKELELDKQYPFYKQWVSNFKATFVYTNIDSQLNKILFKERL
jgi:hypothetical protein